MPQIYSILYLSRYSGRIRAASAITAVGLFVALVLGMRSIAPPPGSSAIGGIDAPSLVIAPGTRTSPDPVMGVNTFIHDLSEGQPGQSVLSNLFLSGVLATDAPEGGWAFIGSVGGPVGLYAIGQLVPGGGVLVSVSANSVVIDRDGALLSLTLDGRATTGSLSLPSGGITAATASSLPGSNQDPKWFTDRGARSSDQALPADLIRVQPAYSSGSFRGYRIYPGRRGLQFKAAGLEPGDLVLAVNGRSVEHHLPDLDALLRRGQGAAVVLIVSREGLERRIIIDPLDINAKVRDIDSAIATKQPAAQRNNSPVSTGNWDYGDPG